jgi:hypothetical protein
MLYSDESVFVIVVPIAAAPGEYRSKPNCTLNKRKQRVSYLRTIGPVLLWLMH